MQSKHAKIIFSINFITTPKNVQTTYLLLYESLISFSVEKDLT